MDFIAKKDNKIKYDSQVLARTKRSGFLDAESLLRQAEMFMQPDAFKRFSHFYKEQVSQPSENVVNSPKILNFDSRRKICFFVL